MPMKKVFISYTWESEEHREWVQKLAYYLEQFPDLHVVWDMFDLDSSNDKNEFMEKAVYDVDYVLIVATKKYQEKADYRNGGVGIETYLNVAKHWNDLLDKTKQKSHSIVLEKDKDSTPRYLKGHFHVDFSNDDIFENNCEQLLNQINGNQKIARPEKIKTLSTSKKKVIS
ncbi:TIR domain-containing protein [Colwellia psychrerythraea]|uniref:SEFIR domain protein n=1 Tax=Colwellia psychrerythraea TaxID=28229 RepID=A0A099L687_COLPS|nr:TIR domain-containing protein [Colwellia psychrerythraea]KGJ97950.1 SEFIR domain protein [Colwellia psychrerythraea]